MNALWTLGPAWLGLVPGILLLESALKATAVLAAVALLCHLLRKAPAALRHLLWLLALFVALALPLASAFAPWRVEILPARVPAVERTTPNIDSGERRPLRNDATRENRTLQPPSSVRASVDPNSGAGRHSHSSAAGQRVATSIAWSSWVRLALLCTWFVGFLAIFARSIVGAIRLGRIVRAAQPVTDPAWLEVGRRVAARLGVQSFTMLVTRSLPVPVAARLLRPVVLLPRSAQDWTSERLEAVLLHEGAHIQRRDLLAQWVGRMTCAVYWFHPLAWLAAARMRLESERACDDWVLRTGVRASDYAEHLLCIARGVDGLALPAAALGLTGESDFERRVFAILEPAVRHDVPSPPAAAAAALAFACVAIPVAALAPIEARSKQETTAEITVLAARSSQAAQPITSALAENTDDDGARAPVVQQSVTTAPVRQQQQQTQPAPADPRAVAALVDLLADSHREVRNAAIDALGELRATAAVPQLLRALEDSTSGVRSRAVRALGRIADPRAVTPLSRTIALDRDRDVRRNAARALGDIGGETATGFLVQALRESMDEEVREEAIDALGEIGTPAAVQALAGVIASPNRDLRDDALDALARIPSREALDVLIRLLQSPEPNVRQDAARALGRRH
jgi:HEAT repeat protein/beta-lactamase regulating signal transducer with metallopeptidase domain